MVNISKLDTRLYFAAEVDTIGIDYCALGLSACFIIKFVILKSSLGFSTIFIIL